MSQTRTEIDKLLLELASVEDQLLEGPPLGERAILHSRQEELRAAAQELRAAGHDDLTLAQAQDQLTHLEERRSVFIGAHVSHADDSSRDMGSGAAEGPIHAPHALHAGASGLDELEDEISHLQNHIRTMAAR